MATVASKNEFVLCLNNYLYISTITDLKKDYMLKIDVKPGRYQLIPYYDGYVLTEENYVPKLKDIIKIFWSRSDDKGLSGTYHHGESKDVNQLRLFNKYIKPHLQKTEGYCRWWNDSFYATEEYYDLEEEDSENFDESDESFDSEGKEIPVKRAKLDKTESEVDKIPTEREHLNDTDESLDSVGDEISAKRIDCTNLNLIKIPDYHNLPVIFFLNKPAQNLDGFDLEMSGKLNEDIIVWKVKDGAEFIGYAVQSKELINMMGDQAGIAAFSNARAFGNFKWRQPNVPEFEEHKYFFNNSSTFFNPDKPYRCSFKPCTCSVNYFDYDEEKRRKAYTEWHAKIKYNDDSD